MKTRVIVCGCRDFSDKELFFHTLDLFLKEKGGKEDFEIVTGHAKGADMFAEEFATEKGIELKVFKPEWNRYGRGAGPMRNKEMLSYAKEETPFVIAFWDGKSKGTGNMIETAKKNGVETLIIMID